MTRTILISPSDRHSALAHELENLGARVIHWPELSIGQPDDNFALDEAIENIFGYDWLILKSKAAVTYFLRRFERSHATDELDELKILSIGEQTQKALGQTQIHVDLMVDRSTDVLAALEAYTGNLKGLNLIVPCANINRDAFASELEDAGARVDSVLAYRTCSSSDALVKLKTLIAGGGIDFVAFTEPGSVDEFASLFDTDVLSRALNGTGIVCLDKPTSRAAKGYEIVDLLVPAEQSVKALVHLIVTPR